VAAASAAAAAAAAAASGLLLLLLEGQRRMLLRGPAGAEAAADSCLLLPLLPPLLLLLTLLLPLRLLLQSAAAGCAAAAAGSVGTTGFGWLWKPLRLPKAPAATAAADLTRPNLNRPFPPSLLPLLLLLLGRLLLPVCALFGKLLQDFEGRRIRVTPVT
jgi:hypothetical protein